MIVLGRRTRERILSEVLRTLRLHLDSGLIAWAETAPERDSVVASEIMVQAQRVQICPLRDRKIPNQTIEGHKGRWQASANWV